jgi:hypothetical protein
MKAFLALSVPLGCIILLLALLVGLNTQQYNSAKWVTLAEIKTSNGGSCIVRELPGSFLFADVAFAFRDSAGVAYGYPLENDGFYWHAVGMTEKSGVVQVWRGRWLAASFNLGSATFTNFQSHWILDRNYGLSHSYGVPNHSSARP